MPGLVHPRHWSNSVWVAVGFLFLALLLVAALIDVPAPSPQVVNALTSIAPPVGALIALASLVVTAASTAASWRRLKRQATIEAWSKWTESASKAGEVIGPHLGSHRITLEQGRALVADDDQVVLKDEAGEVMPSERKLAVRRSLTQTLNGLERLAIGAELGVYDVTTLRRLGATIIVRQFERFEPYIEERRTSPDPNQRQQHAYDRLEGLVRTLRRYQLDEERLRELRMRA